MGPLVTGRPAITPASEHADRVPDVFTPPPGNPRFPLFDGLRAVAAISVLLTHAAFLSGYTTFGGLGRWTANFNVGVTIFFVISGFLLYRPYIAAHMAGRTRPSDPALLSPAPAADRAGLLGGADRPVDLPGRLRDV